MGRHDGSLQDEEMKCMDRWKDKERERESKKKYEDGCAKFSNNLDTTRHEDKPALVYS
jgi:hypothetical protein